MSINKISKCIIIFLFLIILGTEKTLAADISYTHNDSIDMKNNDQNYDYKIKAIHPGLKFNDWTNKDKLYLEKLYLEEFSKADGINTKLIQKEIGIIRGEIDELKKSYTKTRSGAKLYSPSVTGSLYSLYTSVENRMLLLKNFNNFTYSNNLIRLGYNNSKYISNNKEKYIDINKFSIEQKELDILYNSTLEILDKDYNRFPKDILKDLPVMIMPFQAGTFNAATYMHNGYKATNPCIVMTHISSRLNQSFTNNEYIELINNVFLHELGHVFYFDTIIDNLDEKPYTLKNSVESKFIHDYISKLYPSITNKNDNLPDFGYRISENFAEDFAEYFMQHKYHKIEKEIKDYRKYEYNKNFDKFISDYMNNYNKTNKDSVNVTVKSEEYEPININSGSYGNTISLVDSNCITLSSEYLDDDKKIAVFSSKTIKHTKINIISQIGNIYNDQDLNIKLLNQKDLALIFVLIDKDKPLSTNMKDWPDTLSNVTLHTNDAFRFSPIHYSLYN